MNDSKQIKSLVHDMVNWYATYSRTDGFYVLNVFDIPEVDLNNLAGLIISQSDDYAAEAIGFDNDDFDRHMRSSLVKAMCGKKDSDSMEEFHDTWVSGVRGYLMPCMTRLIEDALDDFNGEQGCTSELAWDRGTERTIEIRHHG
jgi:hypothetical protein